MPENPATDARLLAPAQVAEMLGVSVDDVMELVHTAQLRGVRVGSAGRWQIEAQSIESYLDDAAEIARRTALWRQSQEASFPELWGNGLVRNSD